MLGFASGSRVSSFIAPGFLCVAIRVQTSGLGISSLQLTAARFAGRIHSK